MRCSPKHLWPLLVSLAVGGATGYWYWSVTDWWAYAAMGGEMRPKFEMPQWFQCAESAIVGLIASVAIMVAILCMQRLWRRLTVKSP